MAQDLENAVAPTTYAWTRLSATLSDLLRQTGAEYGIAPSVLDALAVATLCRGLTVAALTPQLAAARALGPRYRPPGRFAKPASDESETWALADIAIRHHRMPPTMLEGPSGADAKALDAHEQKTREYVLSEARRSPRSTFARAVRAELKRRGSKMRPPPSQRRTYARRSPVLRRPARRAARVRRVARAEKRRVEARSATDPPPGPEDGPDASAPKNQSGRLDRWAPTPHERPRHVSSQDGGVA